MCDSPNCFITVGKSNGNNNFHIIGTEEWKEETGRVCKECTKRLSDYKTVFAIMKDNVKDEEDLSKLKSAYKEFVRDMKSDFRRFKDETKDVVENSRSLRRSKRYETMESSNKGNQFMDKLKDRYYKSLAAMRGE